MYWSVVIINQKLNLRASLEELPCVAVEELGIVLDLFNSFQFVLFSLSVKSVSHLELKNEELSFCVLDSNTICLGVGFPRLQGFKPGFEFYFLSSQVSTLPCLEWFVLCRPHVRLPSFGSGRGRCEVG